MFTCPAEEASDDYCPHKLAWAEAIIPVLSHGLRN